MESYRLKRLIDDALDLIEYADPDIEVNRSSILSAMKLDKICTAEKRASESLSLVLDLSVIPESISGTMSQVANNIDNIGELLAYNNQAYSRIINIISEILGGN